MALEGTLRDFSLADIFQLISLQRKTGVLTLRSPEDVVSISFLDGKVVGADSLNKRIEDRLGQVLLKTRAVPEPELERALKVQTETLERLGHILLRHNVISRDELRQALEQQILQIIFRVFRWADGDYHFSQETSIDYDQELVVPMGAESILMEGARMLDEWPIIEKKIPARSMVFLPTPAARAVEISAEQELEDLDDFDFEIEKTPAPPPTTSRLRVSQLEADVLRLLDGTNTVDDVIRKSPAGEFDTCKALYSLLTRSLVREASEAEIAAAAAGPVLRPTPPVHHRVGLPWFALLVLPLLACSVLIAPRNPLNPLLGPGPKLMPRFAIAASSMRMWGMWQTLQARGMLVGSFPETLAELQREGYVHPDLLKDPWGRPYRYILKEQALLLAGNSSSGTPDPSLILSRRLGGATSEDTGGPGASLVAP